MILDFATSVIAQARPASRTPTRARPFPDGCLIDDRRLADGDRATRSSNRSARCVRVRRVQGLRHGGAAERCWAARSPPDDAARRGPGEKRILNGMLTVLVDRWRSAVSGVRTRGARLHRLDASPRRRAKVSRACTWPARQAATRAERLARSVPVDEEPGARSRRRVARGRSVTVAPGRHGLMRSGAATAAGPPPIAASPRSVATAAGT